MDRYEIFPITEDDMNNKYMECNGNCIEPDNFYPMTAVDESSVFENNEAAYQCYKSVGFKEISMGKEDYFSILGKNGSV